MFDDTMLPVLTPLSFYFLEPKSLQRTLCMCPCVHNRLTYIGDKHICMFNSWMFLNLNNESWVPAGWIWCMHANIHRYLVKFSTLQPSMFIVYIQTHAWTVQLYTQVVDCGWIENLRSSLENSVRVSFNVVGSLWTLDTLLAPKIPGHQVILIYSSIISSD